MHDEHVFFFHSLPPPTLLSPLIFFLFMSILNMISDMSSIAILSMCDLDTLNQKWVALGREHRHDVSQSTDIRNSCPPRGFSCLSIILWLWIDMRTHTRTHAHAHTQSSVVQQWVGETHSRRSCFSFFFTPPFENVGKISIQTILPPVCVYLTQGSPSWVLFFVLSSTSFMWVAEEQPRETEQSGTVAHTQTPTHTHLSI